MSQITRVPYSTTAAQQLADVQNKVNTDTTYVTDQEQYGVPDYWAVMKAQGKAKMKGDCEDYALTKMKMLRGLGWPPASLDIAVCLDELGEGHAVLIAHTDKGDYVLDNRFPQVMLWRDERYKWIETSQGGDFNSWVAVPNQ